MFCPNCGANNSTEQNFCRSCGLNLEKTAESLLEQIPTAESANLLKQKNLLEKFGNVTFGGLVTVFLLGISILVFTIYNKMILSGTNVSLGFFLIFLVIFGMLSLVYVFLNETLKKKKSLPNPVLNQETGAKVENREFEKKDTARLLEDKPFEPVPSVVEDSTELLKVENKTRKIK
jgi:hypothetical protein